MSVFTIKDGVTDSAEYLVEMLGLWGGQGAEACLMNEVSRSNNTIIVPSGVTSEIEGLKGLFVPGHI